MYIDIFVDIGVPRLGARLPNYEQKWPSFSNVQHMTLHCKYIQWNYSGSTLKKNCTFKKLQWFVPDLLQRNLYFNLPCISGLEVF